MAGAGTEVGRIHIKVTPDTSGFREQLNRELKAAVKGLDAEIPAELKNAAKVEQQLKKLTRKRTSEIGVDLNSSFADRALAQVQDALDKLRSSGKDVSLFEAAAKGLEQKIRNIPLEPELVRGWEDDIRLELARMESMVVDIRPDLGGGARLQAQMAAELAHLQTVASLSKIQVPVELNIDRNRVSRALSSVISGISSAGASLGQGIANGLYNVGNAAVSAVKGFIRLGENGMILVAVLGLIAPALALVSGALVALPAAVAGFVVPIGAIALGLDGIKKAAENAGLIKGGKVKKGESKLGQALDEIKTKVSDVFERGLTPAFNVIGDLVGKIITPMETVAQGLVDMFTGVTDVLGDAKGANQLQNIITNIGNALSAAKPGVKDFFSGILDLVSELSNKFPGLSEAFNRTARSFVAWVDDVTKVDPSTGVSKLDTAMKTLGDTLSGLGGIVSDFLSNGFKNLSDLDFGDSMTSFVDSVRSLVNDTLPALANAFQVIATAIKPVAVIVDAIDAVLNRLGSASIPTIDPEQGSQSWMETLFGKPGKWIDEQLNPDALRNQASKTAKEVATAFQSSLAEGVSAGGNIGAGLLTNLDDIGPAVQQQIKNAINVSAEDQKQALRSAFTADGVDAAVAQQLTTQITAAVESAKGALANLGPELQAQIDAAVLPLATIGDRVGEAFSTLGPAVATAWEGVVTSLTTGSEQVGTAVTNSFNGVSLAATTAFTGIQQSITGAFGFMVLAIGQQAQNINVAVGQALSGLPMTVAQAFGQIPATIATSMGGVAQAVMNALAPAVNTVATVAAGMLQAMNAGLSALPGVVQGWFGAVPAIIGGEMSKAIVTVADVCGQIINQMLSYAGAAENAGRAIGASFAAGLGSAAGLVEQAASGLMGLARAFFPSSPAEKGPFSGQGWVTYSGKSIGEGFADGLSSSSKEVIDTVKALMQAVKDVFGDASGLALNFNLGGALGGGGASSLGGLQSSMLDLAGNAKEFQSNMIGTVNPIREIDAGTKGQIDSLSQQLAVLEMRRKELELMRAGDKGNEAIRAELEQIKNAKLALGLEKDKLTYAQKYNGTVSDTSQRYADYVKTAASMPMDFATATANQALNDIGIPGGGLLGAAMDWGSQLASNAIGMGSNYIFNVSNVDEAIAVKNNQTYRESVGSVGR